MHPSALRFSLLNLYHFSVHFPLRCWFFEIRFLCVALAVLGLALYLELRDLLASASQVQGLKVCTTTVLLLSILVTLLLFTVLEMKFKLLYVLSMYCIYH